MSVAYTPPRDLASLIHSKERPYFAIAATVGVAVYALLLWLVLTNAVARPTIILYGGMAVLFSIATHGFMLGHIRANGVRVSVRQFPKLYSVVVQHAEKLAMAEPDVYVLQAGGALNAFATRFLGRNFVVLYSDVLAMAERRGASAVSFVVGHELAHIKRGHLKYRWLLGPALIVPFLRGAYFRACEYTCDQFGAFCAPEGAIHGLLALAAGGELFEQVEPRLFAAQATTEAGFWLTTSELFASHPHLSKRVGALLQTGHIVPTDSSSYDHESGEHASLAPATITPA